MSKPIPEELLSAYLDGELSPPEMESVREQLAIKENADKLAALRKNQQRLRKLPNFQLGDDFAERVIAAIEFENSSEQAPAKPTLANDSDQTSWRMALAAITSLAAILILGLFMRPAPTNTTNRVSKIESISAAGADSAKDVDDKAPDVDGDEKDNNDGGLTFKKGRNEKKEENLPHVLADNIQSGNSNSAPMPGSKVAPNSKKRINLRSGDRKDFKAKRSGPPPLQITRDQKKTDSPKKSGASPAQQVDKGFPAEMNQQKLLKNVYRAGSPAGESSYGLEEIVQVKVGQNDFDNYSVEKALLANKISCNIPTKLERQKLSQKKPAVKHNKGQSSQEQISDVNVNEGIRFLMVEAPDKQLLSTFKQLRNVKIKPWVLADSQVQQPLFDQMKNPKGLQNSPNNQFGGGMGGGGKGDQENLNPQKQQMQSSNKINQMNNRARNYVDPADISRSKWLKRARGGAPGQNKNKYSDDKTKSESQTLEKGSLAEKEGKSAQDNQSKKADVGRRNDVNESDLFETDEEVRKISEYFALVPRDSVRRMILVIQSDPAIDAELAKQAELKKVKSKPQPTESARPKK